MASHINGSGTDMTPTQVLNTLTSLLGTRTSSGVEASCSVQEEGWSKLPWETKLVGSEAATANAEDMSNGCDFSSFPSLSLAKRAGTVVDTNPDDLLHQKEGVEAHVASLLARPILVSNDQNRTDDDEDDEEGSEFVEERVARVPQVMKQNIVLSFSTLVQSRLRAYATFLARHGLSLAATTQPSGGDLEDGVVGVEHKLETLLELGSLVAVGDVHMSYQAQTHKATNASDGDDLQVSMPLRWHASISVLIPNMQGTRECLTIDLDTTGAVTGIFTNSAQPTHLLRVVQVDLDMPQLLASMKEGAARTVCRVVEMTNAAYSVPLPRVLSNEFAPGGPLQVDTKCNLQDAETNTKKRRAHVIKDDVCVITPDLQSEQPPCRNPSDLDLAGVDEDFLTLSPDKCGKIVDSLFDKIDVRVLSPPGKRARFKADGDVDAITLTLPVV